jgi:4-amino-4-deoxy-L-arabinose transferase-like glycosyltransferase
MSVSDGQFQPSNSRLLLLWLAAGLALALFLGHPAVMRTQEARVLETARQMLGKPIHDWIIPKLNEEQRLQKPPVTYWMTAASFKLINISEFAGRVPPVLCAWMTLLITYMCAKTFFTPRIALLSSATLLGSYMFFRHARLAETDTPVMLCVTVSTFAFWKAVDLNSKKYFHFACAASGLAALTKGPPALFPILFFITLVLTTKNFRAFRVFLFSGALITFLLALTWYGYVLRTVGSQTILFELHNVSAGADHKAWPWVYIPMLLIAMLPWCVLLPFEIYYAFTHFADPRLRALLIWIASILLPLCIAGNKQFHYLAPLMPPMFILTGVFLDSLLGKRSVEPLIAVCTLITLGFAVVIGYWLPMREHDTSRDIAREIFPDTVGHPVVYFGGNRSLPLCFALRRDIPSVYTTNQLKRRSTPGLIVIAQTKNDLAPPALPRNFDRIREIRTSEQLFEVYRAR